MRRHLLALTLLLLAGCRPGDAVPTPVEAPADHTRQFERDHRLRTGCAACHGVDPCARCHLTREPRDHHPGFAGPAHGIAARVDAERCATCHAAASGGCARCHR